MGAQDEYLRNFCILRTDRGIIPLTDPLQIAIFDKLQGKMRRPIDLSTELGMSSSSLHFIIDKMEEAGIVNRIKPESDKKSVYYISNAIALARSVEVPKEVSESAAKRFEGPLSEYGGLSTLADMVDAYTTEIGLDISYLKDRYATDLADSIGLEKKGMEDAILDVRDEFSKLTGYNFSVFSFSPLTLVVSGKDVMTKHHMMLKFITRMIEDSTGRYYEVSTVERFNGSDDMIKVVLDRKEPEKNGYINTSMHHKDDQRFLVMDLDGNAGLMTSDVQMQIVDAIYERPLCITDIVNKVDSPRSTITSNLLRMVEEGVVSVFYSESGSAYYGLACSILAKKSHPLSVDNEEIRTVLDTVKDRENAFMEGFLLYTMACMKKMGFDTEYVMVVLGAKYMRAMGGTDAKGDFDTYFGQMSDVAKVIGLSLNIVSVYPLTIGITTSDPESAIAPAMTFIKGMAHQGLEMASSGIFVRSVEDENISFKEIYPALSMTPVKGIRTEDLSAPTTSKRTSSVKTALLNRSKKTNGSTARTVRYITAVAFLVLLSAFIVLNISGEDTSAETYDLEIDNIPGVAVYDDQGNELSYPYNFESGATVMLTVESDTDIGYVNNGIAYRLDPDENGTYEIKMKSDLYIQQLYDISSLEDLNCPYEVYSSSKELVDQLITFIDSDTYKELSNGLYVSSANVIRVYAEEGYYIESDTATGSLLQSYTCDNTSFKDLRIKEMPDASNRIILGSESFIYGDQIVTGEIKLDTGLTSVQLKLVGDKNVKIKADGQDVELDNDNCFTLKVPSDGDIKLSVEERGLY